MPSFCRNKGCDGDMYVCQICGNARCSIEEPAAWLPIKGTEREGNVCEPCKARNTKVLLDQPVGEKLEVIVEQRISKTLYSYFIPKRDYMKAAPILRINVGRIVRSEPTDVDISHRIVIGEEGNAELECLK